MLRICAIKALLGYGTCDPDKLNFTIALLQLERKNMLSYNTKALKVSIV